MEELWFELNGIDEDNPVLAVEADLAKEREEKIEDAIELADKEKGITPEVIENGVTEMTVSDEQKPVDAEPLTEQLDERLFADFEESVTPDELSSTIKNFANLGARLSNIKTKDAYKVFDIVNAIYFDLGLEVKRLRKNLLESVQCNDGKTSLNEEMFNDTVNPLDAIDPSKPFNADEYETEDEARMAFELYIAKKYHNNRISESLEDNEAICPISHEDCPAVEDDETPYERWWNDVHQEVNDEIIDDIVPKESTPMTEAAEPAEDDPTQPPELMWKYQGGEGLAEEFGGDSFQDIELKEGDWTDSKYTASNSLSKPEVLDAINRASTVDEIVKLSTNAIPENRRGQKSVARFLQSLPKDKTVDRARAHVYNFILADKDAVVEGLDEPTIEEDFIDNLISSWTTNRKDVKVTEGLLFENRGDRNIDFLYTLFQYDDNLNWSKAYEQLLELNSPNALTDYKKLSDSAKAYIAQLEFNRLPADVIALVDRTVNMVWLTRRSEPKTLEQLQSDFTAEDKELLPQVEDVTKTWAGRARELAGME